MGDLLLRIPDVAGEDEPVIGTIEHASEAPFD